MNLRQFIGKRIKIIDIDGKEWTGKATCLDLAINYDDMKYDELLLKPDNRLTGEVAFPENEIKSIEVI